MRFYYHMSGDGIGTLSVFRKSEEKLHLLLNLTGDQGHYWQMREILLSSRRDFQVVFEGKVGRSPKGDICLDDITFSPGCLLVSSAGVEDNNRPPSAGIHLSLSFRWATFCVYFTSTVFSYPPLSLPPGIQIVWKTAIRIYPWGYFQLFISLVFFTKAFTHHIISKLDLVWSFSIFELNWFQNVSCHLLWAQCTFVSQVSLLKSF